MEFNIFVNLKKLPIILEKPYLCFKLSMRNRPAGQQLTVFSNGLS